MIDDILKFKLTSLHISQYLVEINKQTKFECEIFQFKTSQTQHQTLTVYLMAYSVIRLQ